MIDETVIAKALMVPCPSTACRAFLGEQCISHVSGRPTLPHRARLKAAGVVLVPLDPRELARAHERTPRT